MSAFSPKPVALVVELPEAVDDAIVQAAQRDVVAERSFSAADEGAGQLEPLAIE